MKHISKAELNEVEKDVYASIFNPKLEDQDFLIALIHMARVSLKPEISEKEIVDHSQRFEKRFWAPAPAWQAGARWAVGKMKDTP